MCRGAKILEINVIYERLLTQLASHCTELTRLYCISPFSKLWRERFLELGQENKRRNFPPKQPFILDPSLPGLGQWQSDIREATSTEMMAILFWSFKINQFIENVSKDETSRVFQRLSSLPYCNEAVIWLALTNVDSLQTLTVF